jgi:flagellar motor switch protein FliN/FliY
VNSKDVVETQSRLDRVTDSIVVGQASSESETQKAAAPVSDEWGGRGREAVMRIPVSVQIVIGSVRMPISKIVGLTRGSIIPLDRKVGDLVDVVVNDRVVARGEVVALDEDAEQFAIAVREVISAGET